MSEALEKARELVKMLEEMERTETEVEDKVELSTLNPGDVIKGKEHDYIVLKQMNGQTMIISKGFMLENETFGVESADYSQSTLKKKIESELLPIFEDDFGKCGIVEHEVDLTTVDNQKPYENCKCKVRPINFDEAREFNDLIADKDLSDWWWTCTAWSTEERGHKRGVAVVCPSGGFGRCGSDDVSGVRPVCILKSNIFVSKGEK